MQLSKCQKNTNLFLLEEELVNFEYVLRKIHEGKDVTGIRFVVPDENLKEALSNAVKEISEDANGNIHKDSYPLRNLTLLPVEVDIEKSDIKQVGEYSFCLMDEKTKLQNFANLLNGKKYKYPQFTKDELQYAKDNGIVILYGASDDLVEMEGAICDEGGCFDGGTLFLTPKGFHEEDGVQIYAFWCSKEHLSEMGEIITWTYETKVPHETFMIYDEDEPYCKGLVFYAKDLEVVNE